MNSEAIPFERFYDLDKLGRAGADIAVAADEEALKRLAAWAKVETVERFQGAVALKKAGPSRFTLDYTLSADIVQACVVTLEPVRAHVALEFSRELHLAPTAHRHAVKGDELTIVSAADDVPEEIDSPRYDLAAPLLEEFLLAIDPYPRAPGANLPDTPETAAPVRESPFAALKALKERS